MTTNSSLFDKPTASSSHSHADAKERIFSHSSLASYRRCRVQYYWKYVRGYAPQPSIGQIRGTLGHMALAVWYTTWDVEKSLKAASDELTNIELKYAVDYSGEWDFIETVLRRYFKWSKVVDNFETVAIEKEFNIDINGHTITGYIDGIVKRNDTDMVWILEHKFMQKASIKHLDLDPQCSIYLLAANMLGYRPEGVLYNVVRMATGEKSEAEPAARSAVFRSPEGLWVIRQELDAQMKEMDDFHTKGGGRYRNATKDCSWDCSFYQACLSINSDGSAESILSRVPMEPYTIKGELKADDFE